MQPEVIRIRKTLNGGEARQGGGDGLSGGPSGSTPAEGAAGTGRGASLVSSRVWLPSPGRGLLRIHGNRTQWKRQRLEKATKHAHTSLSARRLHIPVDSTPRIIPKQSDSASCPQKAACHQSLPGVTLLFLNIRD